VPRRGTNRRNRTGPPPSRGPVQPVESAADGDWVVRPLTGSGSDKAYRCPGCDQEIRPRTPHVVTWPAYARDSDLDPWDTESAADWRRHWHTACWRARDRRR
jgi:hypothetical protein